VPGRRRTGALDEPASAGDGPGGGERTAGGPVDCGVSRAGRTGPGRSDEGRRAAEGTRPPRRRAGGARCGGVPAGRARP